MELTLEITDSCNYNCIHCSSPSRGPPGRILSLETIARAIDDLKPSKIVLSGGEPFLHPSIASIIDVSKGSGATLACNTCGFFKTRILPNNIKKIDEFYVSFFKEENEEITRPKEYMKFSTPISMWMYGNALGKDKIWLNVVMIDPQQIVDIPLTAYYLRAPVHLVRLVKHGRATSLDPFPNVEEQRGMALSIMRQLDPELAKSRIPYFLKYDGYKTMDTYAAIQDDCIKVLEDIYPRCKVSHSLLEGYCRAAEKRTLLVDGRLIGCVAGKGRDERIGAFKACV